MSGRIINAGVAQLSFSADVEANRRQNIEAVRTLARQGAQLVVLSELHDSLYFCQTENVDNFDLALSLEEFSAPYCKAAAETGCVIVASMFERRAPGLYHNTAIVIDSDGSIAGKYRKMHIPDDPAYYEKFYFTPGDLGFEPVKTSLGKIGVLVCWDQWYPEAARIMALRGAEMLVYPTAIGWESTDTPDEKERQREAWITVQRGHAVANGLPVITANRVGHEPDPSSQTGGILFWGSSFVAGPQGELLWQAPSDKPEMKVIPVDMDRSESVRRWWPFLRDRRIEAYNPILSRYLD